LIEKKKELYVSVFWSFLGGILQNLFLVLINYRF